MFKESEKIERMEFIMSKKERIEGKLVFQESEVKLNRRPLKLYTRQISPKEGLEVMYCEGLNNEKALVNPNGFPWFTLKLEPEGSVMRKAQHHTILNSGYDYLISILKHLFDKYGNQTRSKVRHMGMSKWQGHSCHVILFENPDFKHVKYRVKENETLLNICDRQKISEYMVMELNPSIDDLDHEFEPGDELIIPNDYSPKMMLYVDRERLIPLMFKVYDEKGLYEQFEYTNVVIDPVFSDSDFDPDNEAYDF